MSWNELLHLVGQDWMLFGLTCILLAMFLRRAFRVGGFLGITGVIATVVLLSMLGWIQWNKYQVGTTIVQIIQEKNPAYAVLTPEQTPIAAPSVVTVDGVRYVVDAALEKQTQYYPWRVIAVPR